MNDTAVVALSPKTVLGEMKKNRVTHVVWLPDSETNWLYLLMKAEPSLRLVGVSREGHACSIAAGLSVAGSKPLILIQNTGMMESGDSLRGWLLGLNIPVVLMVGYRGWTRHGVTQDSAATYTERFLMAFGINYYLVENDADSPRISIAPRRRNAPRGPWSCSSVTNTTASIGRESPLDDAHSRYVEGLAPYREDAIVVPGRGGRYWTDLTTRPNLDVPVGDPAMGGHAGFALGLALARPEKRVVLFDSEGDILMSLGMLVTIAEQQPANFYHFLIDNGCYATTGGQPVPNAENTDYDVIARGAGYPRAFAFRELEKFSAALPDILGKPGPVFVAVKVAPEIENAPIGRRRRWQTRTRDQVIKDLRTELGISG
jgi:sulfopyruvate decarboxylase subunit alpha